MSFQPPRLAKALPGSTCTLKKNPKRLGRLPNECFFPPARPNMELPIHATIAAAATTTTTYIVKLNKKK